MKPILEIQNISKKYRIQHMAGGYLSLRERMVNALKFQRNQEEDFWALKDVSFEVHAGESIGIIGRNGAGKSTLLKILSKITPPTTGRIVSRGRIASLLEVGTGFHPELTGRENIFFNGSLLGMKRKEIERKFDEIVDFSGVEKFLDTPLKHFSSGMQLRLAFAVAAFLEPEILIIDEVLAVGDAEFQKKCLGKMEDVSKSGRTILFVSHNMRAVESLCQRVILLSNGTLSSDGMHGVINHYLSDIYRAKDIEIDITISNKSDEYLSFESVKIVNLDGDTMLLRNSDDTVIQIEYVVKKTIPSFQLFVDLVDSFDNVIFRTFHYEPENATPPSAKIGHYISCLTIPKDTLIEGHYKIVVKAASMYERMIEPAEGIIFSVGIEERGKFIRKIYQHQKGFVTVNSTWDTRLMNS
jgi:lipopolysaccharide transport system ATP-binding protein